jgi:hypothetical protein
LLQADGEPVTARPLRGGLSDPEDLALLEVAAQAEATLITGCTVHYPDRCGVRVHPPVLSR